MVKLKSIAMSLDYEIWKTDVKTTFLNSVLKETIYMDHLEGFIKNDNDTK